MRVHTSIRALISSTPAVWGAGPATDGQLKADRARVTSRIFDGGYEQFLRSGTLVVNAVDHALACLRMRLSTPSRRISRADAESPEGCSGARGFGVSTCDGLYESRSTCTAPPLIVS